MPITDDQLAQGVANGANTAVKTLSNLDVWQYLPDKEKTHLKSQHGWLYTALLQVESDLLGLVAYIADPLLAAFVDILGKVRESLNSLNDLGASVLNEFLGTNLSGTDVTPLAGSADQGLAKAQKIGSVIHSRLWSEFAPGQAAPTSAGAKAAQTFTGYAANFALQNGILGLIGAAVPKVHLDEVRELGEGVAEALGLGRLSRQALGPLVKNTIATPYDRELCSIMRPNLLSPADYVKMFQAGLIDHPTLLTRLAEHGYTDSDIEAVVQIMEPDMSMASIEILIRHGVITQDQAVTTLTQRGWPTEYAQWRLQATALARVDRRWDEYVAVLLEQVHKRTLSLDGFKQMIYYGQDSTASDGTISVLADAALSGGPPYTQDEKQMLVALATAHLNRDDKLLSWGQVSKAYEIGAVSLDYVDAWLTQQTFSQNDAAILETEMLAAVSAKNAGESAKASHGKLLTWANVKDAYKARFIDLGYVQTWLTEEGFSAADSKIMQTLLPPQNATS
jgi:hypothetical protein